MAHHAHQWSTRKLSRHAAFRAEAEIDDLFARPQRLLSSAEIEREAARLLIVVTERGVSAILPDVATCRPLLESLAEACRRAGLIAETQYLDYLAQPHD